MESVITTEALDHEGVSVVNDVTEEAFPTFHVLKEKKIL